MANNFFKVDKGVTLAPQSSVASPQNGDVYYDSTRNTYVFRNNGQNTDLQKRSDVATAASLTSSDFTASVIQSSFVKLTGSTSGNIHGFVASSDAKMFVLYNASSAIMTIKNQSTTEVTAGNRIVLPNSADLVLTAGKALQFSYDSTQSRWVLVSSSSGSGGLGGGSKNYLSAVTTSQSTTPNTGNGDFESGSTTGWSLGTTGTLTNGLPTGSPTFGSGASGNLSISVVSSGTLAGSYSLSYASSAATTQGNMLASDAFNIDNQDQGKVLTWKFYYKAQTNPTNANWSGTSSNSFGVAVWDVTNSQWLGTSANFAMTQSFGIGTATGSFQTNINTTQLRFVVYNANATSGAITLYFDDFVVGPTVIIQGTPTSDWKSYTPTFNGFGSVTNIEMQWRRFGDSVQIRGKFTGGTPTGVEARMGLPSGLTSADTTRIPSIQSLGNMAVYGHATTTENNTLLIEPSVSYCTFGIQSNSNGGLTKQTDTNILASGQTISIGLVTIPVQGWSSEVQMSSDTDTRVVALKVTLNSFTHTANNTEQLIGGWNAPAIDTHAGFNSTTGEYTCAVSGLYRIGAVVDFTNNTTGNRYFSFRKNGNLDSYSIQVSATNSNASIGVAISGTTIIAANAGDKLSIYGFQNSGGNLAYVASTATHLSIERISGPSVIAANEKISLAYNNVTGTVGAKATYSNKEYDSHSAYNNGVFTAPATRKYRISATIFYSATFSAGQNSYIQFFKNGSLLHEKYEKSGSSSDAMVLNTTEVFLLAGETLEVRGDSAGTGATYVSSATRNRLTISSVD